MTLRELLDKRANLVHEARALLEGAERELRVTLSLEPSSRATREYLEWVVQRRLAGAEPTASSGGK